MQVKSLAVHFNVTRKTVYEWFNLWDAGNISQMPLKGGSGAKKKLRNVPSEEILRLVREYPRNLKPVLCRLSKDYGIDVSERTLHRFLKICRADLAQSAQVIEVQAEPGRLRSQEGLDRGA
jgi:transposase